MTPTTDGNTHLVFFSRADDESVDRFSQRIRYFAETITGDITRALPMASRE
jgi:hypothetical protein